MVFKTGIDSTPEGVRDALYEVRNRLRLADVCEEHLQSVELVVAEALNNIVEHALRDEPDSKIQLSMNKANNAVEFHICDPGAPMPNGRLPLGVLPTIGDNVASYPEGGFGWGLIRLLTHDLKYERAPGENRLTFRLELSE